VYRKLADCKQPDGRSSAVAQVVLADFLAGRASLDEALATFRKAVALDPKNMDYAQYRIVDILEQQAKAAEARAELCRIIAGRSGEAVAHHRLGRLLMSRGESHGAILAFREALRLYPQATNAHLMNDPDGTPARLIAVNDLAAAYVAAGLLDLAEPLLIQGYEEMKQREAKIPDAGKDRLTEALERLVALYEVTQQKDKAADWRKKLDERKQPPKKPSP
jgi:lipopolysaccharide biosynthesis regulator YciM